MKKLRLLALLLVATVPFAACDDDGTPTEPDTGSIAGTVVVEGSPLSGVSVAISGPESATATTDSNGEYQFQDVETGSYTIEIADGVPEDVTFETSAKDATVAGDQTETVDFSGDYIRTASISGQVTAQTEDGEANVSGITVNLTGTEEQTVQTDQDGFFVFDGLRAGSYTVSLDTEGLDIEFDQTSQQVEVSVGGSAEVNFTGLQPKAAQVYIQRLTNMFGTRINPDDVEGRIFVHLAVEPGTETVSRVAIELDNEEVASQDVNVTSASSEAPASAATTVELSVNTAAFDEQTLQVDYPNGEYDLTATLETAEGSTAEASQSQVLTFDNEDILTVQFVDGTGNTAVSDGVRWHGGATFALQGRALLYSAQVEIDQLGVTCQTTAQTANGGASLDIGAGAGAEMVVSGPPFEYSAAQDDNVDAVEDLPPSGGGAGHTCMVSSVIDPDGLELIDQFNPGNIVDLEEFFVDFTSPAVNDGAPSEILVDGDDPDGTNKWYSAGDFELSNLTELGVGPASAITFFSVDDGGTTTEPDFASASSIADITEAEPPSYTATVSGVEDGLGNSVDLSATPVDAGDGADNESETFGADKTAPAVTAILPTEGQHIVLQPDDQDGTASDNWLLWNAVDPDLVNGDTPSGLGVQSAEADDGTATTALTVRNTRGGDDYDIGVGAAGDALADGTYEITLESPDQAIAPNEAETVWSVTVDATAPDTRIIDPPSSSVSTSNESATFTIKGDATDANGLSEVLLTVRDATGGGNDICELSDPLVPEGDADGEVDNNTLDVTSSASSIEEVFTIQKDAGTTQHVCFFIEAADNARDNEGNLEPNTSDQSAHTDITWN